MGSHIRDNVDNLMTMIGCSIKIQIFILPIENIAIEYDLFSFDQTTTVRLHECMDSLIAGESGLKNIFVIFAIC